MGRTVAAQQEGPLCETKLGRFSIELEFFPLLRWFSLGTSVSLKDTQVRLETVKCM